MSTNETVHASISFAYTSCFTSHLNCTGHANNKSKEKAGDSVQNIVSSLRERPLDPGIQDVNYSLMPAIKSWWEPG